MTFAVATSPVPMGPPPSGRGCVPRRARRARRANYPGRRPLVRPHPPPRLHHRRLDRRVGVLEPEPERGVVRVREVRVGISLEVGEVGGDLGQGAG